MVRTGREKDRGICNKKNMGNGSERTPKDRKTKTEVGICYTKRHEGESSTERRSTRPENLENENFIANMEQSKEEMCLFNNNNNKNNFIKCKIYCNGALNRNVHIL